MSIPIPSALVRHQVTWPIGWAGGTAGPLAGARGHVTFEASATVIAYSEATVLPEAVTTPVIGGVMVPVDLIENDPEVWNWKVTPRLGVSWDSFHINVDGPVNIASAATTPGKGPVRVVKGDQGYQGKSVTRMSQVDESLLRADLSDPATGEVETEYFDLPRGPEGPFGGTEVTAPQVADMIATNSTVREALDQSYRRGFSVTEWGAKGDGTTDDTLAIQAAADAVYATNIDAVLHFPAGTYKTSETVRLRCAVDGGSATISYTGTGTAVVVGADSPDGEVTARRVFNLPRIILDPRPETGWDGTSVGVLAVNLNDCDLSVPHVAWFERGLVLLGSKAGFAYSDVFIGTLWENHKQLVLEARNGGWVNQNVLFNGRFQSGVNAATGRNPQDPDAVQVLMVNPSADFNGPNTNTFIGTSFEDTGVRTYFVDMEGSYNRFINCRWEAPNYPPRIRYRGITSRYNAIEGGYNASSIEEVFEGGAQGGSIRDTVGAYLKARIADTQTIPDSTLTPVTAWAVQNQRRIPAGGTAGRFRPRAGRWRIDLRLSFAANATGRRMGYLMSQTAGGSPTVLAVAEQAAGSSGKTGVTLSTTAAFDGTTEVWASAFQTSGAGLALDTGSGYSALEAEYLP